MQLSRTSAAECLGALEGFGVRRAAGARTSAIASTITGRLPGRKTRPTWDASWRLRSSSRRLPEPFEGGRRVCGVKTRDDGRRSRGSGSGVGGHSLDVLSHLRGPERFSTASGDADLIWWKP